MKKLRALYFLQLSTKYHDMKLNLQKTKLMTFNFSRKYQFTPELELEGNKLEIVQNSKLLGFTVTSDGRRDLNTKNAVLKATSRLWFLRRLKLLGASRDTLLVIYKLFCRSVLEYCAPVWTGNLTKANILSIERVQKSAMKIILGTEYSNYEDALEKN